MNKKTFTIIMAAVMVCSAICAATPASAASKKVYMAAECQYGNEPPREKIGNYYIWMEDAYSPSPVLKCAKSLKSGAIKTVKKTTGGEESVDYMAITDGNTIYYAILGGSKATIYQTTVKGTSHKKVKTVEAGKNFQYFGSLAAFYEGKLYYTTSTASGVNGYSLYSYDIAKKKTRLEKKNSLSVYQGGTGRYITGSSGGGAENMFVYDVKTKKTTDVTDSGFGVVSGKTVYYLAVEWIGGTGDYGDRKNWKYTLKQCDVSGKNKKTIKKIPESMEKFYMGRKAAYFKDLNTGKTKKLTYSTKKFTTVN